MYMLFAKVDKVTFTVVYVSKMIGELCQKMNMIYIVKFECWICFKVMKNFLGTKLGHFLEVLFLGNETAVPMPLCGIVARTVRAWLSNGGLVDVGTRRRRKRHSAAPAHGFQEEVVAGLRICHHQAHPVSLFLSYRIKGCMHLKPARKLLIKVITTALHIMSAHQHSTTGFGPL